METIDLSNLEEARKFVLQGLWLQRVVRPNTALVKTALDWGEEMLSGGQPMPPIGVVADLGNVIFGYDRGRQNRETVEVPGWPPTLARSYEDYFLGKIYADWTFERASDALRRYKGRDQAKGLAFVLKQLRDRGQISGVDLSPAVIRGLKGLPPEEILALGMESLNQEGPMPLLKRLYEQLFSASRRMAEVLGPEDVIALEQRTALADMGQYVAHKQILQVSAKLEAQLGQQRVRPLAGRKEVPTRILDEDQYPVGGYTSISNRGSIESLLHSQLAYMEDEQSTEPDLFQLKFVRDELFFYSRDENQFLRRRRLFVFAFDQDLVQARFKDADLRVQRIVLALGLVLTLVRKLSDWLSTDALKFELVFVGSSTPPPLGAEAELMSILLLELRERGAAEVRNLSSWDQVAEHCTRESRSSQVQVLQLSARAFPFQAEGAVVNQLVIQRSRPELRDGHGHLVELEADEAMEHWKAVTRHLLQLWV